MQLASCAIIPSASGGLIEAICNSRHRPVVVLDHSAEPLAAPDLVGIDRPSCAIIPSAENTLSEANSISPDRPVVVLDHSAEPLPAPDLAVIDRPGSCRRRPAHRRGEGERRVRALPIVIK